MKIGFDREAFDAFMNIGELIPREKIEPKVLSYLEDLAPSVKIGIGVSGGPDSLALALWFYKAYPKLRERTVWLHFNHRLRGVASNFEEVYVTQVAEFLGVKIFLGVGSGHSAPKINEAILREERYGFFKKSANEEGLSGILLGHHADDVAETMLMRWMRGAGVDGLSSPKPIRKEGVIDYIRPFLKIQKNLLIHVLGDLKLPYAQDHTNELPICFRNRLRLCLNDLQNTLPEGAKWNITYTRERLEEEHEALEQILDEILTGNNLIKGADSWHWKVLSQKPKALQRRALYIFLEGIGVVLDGSTLDQCLNDLQNGVRFSQNTKGGRLIFEGDSLKWLKDKEKMKSWPCTPLLKGGAVVLPDGAWVELNSSINFSQKNITHEATWPSLMLIRNRRAGDRYRPKGGMGSKKLSDLLINSKIDHAVRDSLPVVCDKNGSILFVPGLRIAEDVGKNSSIFCALRLTYRQEVSTIKA